MDANPGRGEDAGYVDLDGGGQRHQYLHERPGHRGIITVLDRGSGCQTTRMCRARLVVA